MRTLSVTLRILAAGIAAGGGMWLGVLVTAPAAHAAGAVVAETIANYAYAPNPLSVHVGDTVTWTNEDAAPHTVTSSRGPAKLDSPNFGKRQRWSYTFTEAGTYLYYCAVHPNMRAQVVVAAVSTPAVVAPAVTSPSIIGPKASAKLVSPAVVATAATPPTTVDATASAQAEPALITTTTTTSPGGLHINPLLFLLAVVGGVVVVCVLASLAGRGERDVAAG